ncbi:Ribosomal silencing factor RsfS [Flavimaricola marinus]|uniref:Ribosomal silencing factor RsfS n=2 Tax=Flavimaricola marinus TaxID=1819565 RepID=A0A238LGU4_9RHOB|nr:ribosome silencing factor [Flavimaricola marinus]SMY08110.1 Ribosomal silencing factor RsfS [Flavimaricola marinus]
MPCAEADGGAFQEDNDLSPNTMAASSAAAPAERARKKGDLGMTKATSDALLSAVLASLDEDKAEDVVQIDLRGKSEIGDWMVVCSGRSSRQVNAISEKLTDRLKAEFGVISKVEGKETGDWVLIDTGDIIVHVFRPEVREFYQLEKMWLPAGTDPAASFR